jgi:hypothetical protein
MRRIIIALLTVGLVAAATVPLAASADRDDELVLGVRLSLVSGQGSFAACCAVNDSGTASVTITPGAVRRNRLEFEAIETFVGSRGTFRLALRGTSGPLDSDIHVARGSWRAIGGTGAYDDFEARGRFTAVTNTRTGDLTAINKGEADDD